MNTIDPEKVRPKHFVYAYLIAAICGPLPIFLISDGLNALSYYHLFILAHPIGICVWLSKIFSFMDNFHAAIAMGIISLFCYFTFAYKAIKKKSRNYIIAFAVLLIMNSSGCALGILTFKGP